MARRSPTLLDLAVGAECGEFVDKPVVDCHSDDGSTGTSGAYHVADLDDAARRSGWDWPDNQDDGQGWCRNAGRA